MVSIKGRRRGRAGLQEKEPPVRKRKALELHSVPFRGFWPEGRSFLGGHGGRRGRPQQVYWRGCWLAGGAGRSERPHPETTCAGRKDENGSLRRRLGALGLPRNLARTTPRAPRPSCPQRPAGHGSRLPAETTRVRPAIGPPRPWGTIGAARPEGARRTSARDSSTAPG